VVKDTYQFAIQAGHGEEDFSAIYVYLADFAPVAREHEVVVGK